MQLCNQQNRHDHIKFESHLRCYRQISRDSSTMQILPFSPHLNINSCYLSNNCPRLLKNIYIWSEGKLYIFFVRIIDKLPQLKFKFFSSSTYRFFLCWEILNANNNAKTSWEPFLLDFRHKLTGLFIDTNLNEIKSWRKKVYNSYQSPLRIYVLPEITRNLNAKIFLYIQWWCAEVEFLHRKIRINILINSLTISIDFNWFPRSRAFLRPLAYHYLRAWSVH